VQHPDHLILHRNAPACLRVIAAAATLVVSSVVSAHAADSAALKSKSTYAKEYGTTVGGVEVDPAKDLQRYPAVEPKDAIASWKVKPGFSLQLAAHEPQVRSPIALSFDERGRMFVVEMIDYSEMRDATPHLGRVSMLEDKDGDGYYETSSVFADDLPWPTGIICANGGIYVIATPDVLFFKDTTGAGRADVREVVFTGFGSGLKLLNVQGLANCPQWGLDNRIHIQGGGGNRGKVKCLERPDLPEVELGGRDFWFDPRTYEFGLEAGGAQFGMSFDNYGRKFACSNSDHLQFFVYDERYGARNPVFSMPPSRQSIAADGGAAEVFRLSPDEPWRIIRTRWRVAGVVKGAVEGGGRVSGYFTGATGTTVYRGDAYGAEYVNNTFSGDAGGQLVHRKIIHPDGATLIGRRPVDEQGFEFAASHDTWVRVANFANAPDGCLYVIDMYREVIEHPWSIPDEIKKHLDLNSGNDRGRIYRIAPNSTGWQRRKAVNLAGADTAGLVQTLAHPNGWHRDCAARLLYERADDSAVPSLEATVSDSTNPLAKIHALSVLDGLGALREESILAALGDGDAFVRERGVLMAEKLIMGRLVGDGAFTERLPGKLAALVEDPAERVRFQLTFTLATLLDKAWTRNSDPKGLGKILAPAFGKLGLKGWMDKWQGAALLGAPPELVMGLLFDPLTQDPVLQKKAAPFIAKLIELSAASKSTDGNASLIDFVAESTLNPLWLRALGDGFRRAGITIEDADTRKKLASIFSKAAATVIDSRASDASRLAAIEILGVGSLKQSGAALTQGLSESRSDLIQTAVVRALAEHPDAAITKLLLDQWPVYGAKAREAALTAMLVREERALALLGAIQTGGIKPAELSAAQVQSLIHHKDAKVAASAANALASVLPASRGEVIAKFQPALAMKGEASRGRDVYAQRCIACHRAGDQGIQLGPDLITVKAKGRDGILSAILEPNKEVAPQFIDYTVNTRDGRSLMGFISKDDASGVTLKMIGVGEQTIQRSEIQGTSSSGRSLMPEGIEAGMEVQAMADLLAFIEELK